MSNADDCRQFRIGDVIDVPPMQYRIVRGHKSPDDQRLDWRYVGDWRPVELDHAGLIAAAIAENEDRLYPYPAKGGGKVRAFVHACYRSWRQARHDLHLERARKAERLDTRT